MSGAICLEHVGCSHLLIKKKSAKKEIQILVRLSD